MGVSIVNAVAQKGRDGASFNHRGEGYFGHARDQRPFLCAFMVPFCRKCVFSVRLIVSVLLRLVTFPTRLANCYCIHGLAEIVWDGRIPLRRRI